MGDPFISSDPHLCPGSLEVRDVWTRFGEGRWVHAGLDLRVEPGESVAVIGGSGQGKSQLFRALLGLVRPQHGEVWVDGVDVRGADEAQLYSALEHVGVLFQDGALFDSLCVWENVAFTLRERGLPEAHLRRVASEKLKMVGLKGVEEQMPGELSGGMRKRVGLARAIAHDPTILLCDEPTSGLDPVMSDVISELILQMKVRLGVTTLTITHDMKSAYKIADRIAMLYEGTIRVTGTPKEIQDSDDPLVQQFIQGRALGPIGTGGSARVPEPEVPENSADVAGPEGSGKEPA
jgi:phospholipid/cholesterol/gamma-HCH transport system ATP-binding protein